MKWLFILALVFIQIALFSDAAFAQRNAYRRSSYERSYPWMISVDVSAVLFYRGFGAAISRPISDTVSVGGFFSSAKYDANNSTAKADIDYSVTRFGADLTKHIGHRYFEDGVFVTGVLLNTDLSATVHPAGQAEASTKATKLGYQALGGYQFVWNHVVLSLSGGYGNAASYEVNYNSATGATSSIKDGVLMGVGAAIIF